MKLNQNDIKLLLDTDDSFVRNRIIEEMKNDELGRDALDGVLFSELESSDFKQLDQRFNRKLGVSAYFKWITLVLLISIFSIVFWFQKSEKSNSKSNVVNTKTNENSSIKNSSSLEKKLSESEKTQIPLGKIEFAHGMKESFRKNELSISDEITNNSRNQDEDNQDPAFRLNTLNTGLLPSSTQEFKGETAAEVIMLGLRIVDYRVYRTKIEKPDPMNFSTGTTADFEGKNGQIKTQEFESRNYIDYLNETLKQFQKGEHARALLNFESILSTYDDDINALFYGGLTCYSLKNYDEAIRYFDKARNNRFSNFREEIDWNLLLIYIDTRELDKAIILQSEIITKNGFYAKRAEQLKF